MRGVVGVRGSRGSVAGGRDGVASATRGAVPGVLLGDVDGVPGVGLPGEAGVEGVAVVGVVVEGEDDSTGGGVVDVGSVAGFESPGAVLLGRLDVPGVDDDGVLLSAPG